MQLMKSQGISINCTVCRYNICILCLTFSLLSFLCRVARAATLKSLHSTHMQELAPHHWCCYIDGASVNPDGALLVVFVQKAVFY